MSENRKVTRAAGVVSAATFLSRILGFVRDLIIAGAFGAGFSSDAFFVAFRIPNLLRRLFAEGSLTIAFIPVFTQYLSRKGRTEAFLLARSAVWLLLLILLGVTLLGLWLAPWIVYGVAPGFAQIPAKFALTVKLTRIVFPYVVFICMVAVFMGILNTLGHFAAPALAPALLNIAMIGAVFFISPHMADPIAGLAIGVLIGGALQLGVQIPFLRSRGFCFTGETRLHHPGIQRIGGLMGPAVFGAAVYQINMLVGTLLASLLPEGSVSYLYYADRLVQFPLGIFAIAIATAVLPSLSRQAAAQDFKGLSQTFAHALNLVMFITIPSMAGLIALREPIVALLFQRGAFGPADARFTADALLFYSLGLWAFSAVRIVVSTFYALQDTKTPVWTAALSVLANLLFALIFMGPLKHGGLALAVSLASMINLILLIWSLRARLGPLGWKNIAQSACKSLLCSAIMGIAVWGLIRLILPPAPTLSCRLLGVAGAISCGLLLYIGLAFLFKSRELVTVLAVLGKRLKS